MIRTRLAGGERLRPAPLFPRGHHAGSVARVLARGTGVLALLAALAGPAQRAHAAAPDPTVATLLSVACTVVPSALTLGLWSTSRGTTEGIRFDVGIATLAAGSIVGPSVGQLYAESGTNLIVALLLRAVTGTVMLTGVGFWARGDPEDRGLGQALTAVGGVPTALLALYDIVDASDSAVEAKRARATASTVPVPDLVVGGFSLCASVAGGCRF